MRIRLCQKSKFQLIFIKKKLGLLRLLDGLVLGKKIQNIVIATKAIGDFEGYAVLAFKDIKDLYERVLQIKKLPGIAKIEISFTIPGLNYLLPKQPRP